MKLEFSKLLYFINTLILINLTKESNSLQTVNAMQNIS